MSLVDETVRVRRGGSFLTIPTTAIDRYLAKGYDVVDSSGNVIKASMPTDIHALREAYEKQTAEIKALKARIKELESKPEIPTAVEKSASGKRGKKS